MLKTKEIENIRVDVWLRKQTHFNYLSDAKRRQFCTPCIYNFILLPMH